MINKSIPLTLSVFIALASFNSGAFSQGIDVMASQPEMAIPVQAVPASLVASTQPMVVFIDGREEILAPGATIRDVRDTRRTGRRLILPSILVNEIGATQVKAAIERDISGHLIRIWIVSSAQ